MCGDDQCQGCQPSADDQQPTTEETTVEAPATTEGEAVEKSAEETAPEAPAEEA